MTAGGPPAGDRAGVVQAEVRADRRARRIRHGAARLDRPQHEILGVVAGEKENLLRRADVDRSEEHTSELQSLMRISYAVFCLKKKKNKHTRNNNDHKTNHNT